MPPVRLRIATLDCDTPVPNVYAERGLYSEIFEALLRDAVEQGSDLPDLILQFSNYDCVQRNLPSEEDLRQIDAVIITGSSFSAYENAPWVHSLTSFCRRLYKFRPRIKIFGSCFGHQVLCHALFSTPTHSVVSRDPIGWELGVHSIALAPEFLSHFGIVKSNPNSFSHLRLQFVHADHVVLPIIPEGFTSIGRSDNCALQGVWKQGRVLTYQGHAEFDRFVNCETIMAFGKPIWEDAFLGSALEMVDADDDAIWAASVILKFFLEERLEDTNHMSAIEVNGIKMTEEKRTAGLVVQS